MEETIKPEWILAKRVHLLGRGADGSPNFGITLEVSDMEAARERAKVDGKSLRWSLNAFTMRASGDQIRIRLGWTEDRWVELIRELDRVEAEDEGRQST